MATSAAIEPTQDQFLPASAVSTAARADASRHRAVCPSLSSSGSSRRLKGSSLELAFKIDQSGAWFFQRGGDAFAHGDGYCRISFRNATRNATQKGQGAGPIRTNPLFYMVEPRGIEPLTS